MLFMLMSSTIWMNLYSLHGMIYQPNSSIYVLFLQVGEILKDCYFLLCENCWGKWGLMFLFLLWCWRNGIQQRLNSWQDGVSGTNCPIEPGKNWTYVFQTKDQIGTYTYFPSINFQKSAGGYGPIRVNNRNVILVPFPKPEAEFDLLIGDWMEDYYKVTIYRCGSFLCDCSWVFWIFSL